MKKFWQGVCIAEVVTVVLLGTGCSDEMRHQAQVKSHEGSAFFADGMGSRPKVAGTVSREEGHYSVLELTGRIDGELAARSPLEATKELMVRGREQYRIYCVPCHGPNGMGDGLVTHRGFPQPPAFSEPRLRAATDGHLFDVITNGYGVMYSYGGRVSPRDRWAIVAYVRALQLAETLNEERKGKR